ncbi:unnamed protein product, partial [Iphiclides podalirius]
MIKVAAQGRRE